MNDVDGGTWHVRGDKFSEDYRRGGGRSRVLLSAVF